MPEMLLRQVNPKFSVSEHPGFALEVFMPSPRDVNKKTRMMELSVYDGSMITPQDSYEKHNSLFKGTTVGVCGVSREDVAALRLRYESQPTTKIAEHGFIEFPSDSFTKAKLTAMQLFIKAEQHGMLYRPE